MADEGSSIVIKRVKKVSGGGHGGGAWKVAYADFVTAMMAFFLLLWLLNSVTQEQLEGISNYFAPVSVSSTTSGSGEILGGKVIAEEGASTTETSRTSVTTELPPPRAGAGGEGHGGEADFVSSEAETEAEDGEKNEEQSEMEQDAERIKLALQQDPNLADLANNVIVDVTTEGLRIQIIDRDGKPMFEPGSAKMMKHTREVLAVVSKILIDAPQDIAVEGHTDAGDFDRNGYTNWELSADRANATRRTIKELGIVEARVAYVKGFASQELLFPDKPKDSKNRRIAITLLRGTGGNNPAARYDPLNEALPGLNEIRRQQIEEQIGGDKVTEAPKPVPVPTPAPSAPKSNSIPAPVGIPAAPGTSSAIIPVK